MFNVYQSAITHPQNRPTQAVQGSLGATEVVGPGGLAGGVEPGDVPAVRSLRVLPQTPLLTQHPALAGSRTYC